MSEEHEKRSTSPLRLKVVVLVGNEVIISEDNEVGVALCTFDTGFSDPSLETNKRDAELLVTAFNSYRPLLEALTATMQHEMPCAEPLKCGTGWGTCVPCMARAALDAATLTKSMKRTIPERGFTREMLAEWFLDFAKLHNTNARVVHMSRRAARSFLTFNRVPTDGDTSDLGKPAFEFPIKDFPQVKFIVHLHLKYSMELEFLG